MELKPFPIENVDNNEHLCKYYTNCVVLIYVEAITHLPLDKTAAIVADDNFKYIFLYENDRIPIPISLTFIPRGSNWQ